MNPVETLRAAADRLDELAAKATPGPWCGYIGHDQSHARVVAGPDDGTYLTGIAFDWPEEAVEEFDCLPRQEDINWLNHMGPQVAPALSAWLRAEADTAQASDQTRANFRPSWRDDWSPEDPPPDWSEANRVAALEAMHRHPLAFARMVLGLPAGDAS